MLPILRSHCSTWASGKKVLSWGIGPIAILSACQSSKATTKLTSIHRAEIHDFPFHRCQVLCALSKHTPKTIRRHKRGPGHCAYIRQLSYPLHVDAHLGNISLIGLLFSTAPFASHLPLPIESASHYGKVTKTVDQACNPFTVELAGDPLSHRFHATEEQRIDGRRASFRLTRPRLAQSLHSRSKIDREDPSGY